MAKQSINIGTSANDRTGDSLRSAFNKINENFTDLYTALGLDSGGLNLGAFEFTGSVLTTTDSSAIVIDQATTITSNLTVGGDVVPSVAYGGDLGTADKPWNSLYVSGDTVFIGGTPVRINENGDLTVDGNVVASGAVSYNDLTDTPTIQSFNQDLNTTDSVTFNTVTTPNLVLDGDVTTLNELFIDGGAQAIGIKSQINIVVDGDVTFQNGNITGLTGNLDGDVTGSVFADDSTLLVDGVDGKIRGDIENATVNITSTVGDVNITAEDDIDLETLGSGGDIRITAGDDVTITTNNADGGPAHDWFFSSGGFLDFPEGADLQLNNTVDGVAFTTAYNPVARPSARLTVDTSSSQADLLLHNETTVGHIKLETNAGIWTFGADGGLTFPSNSGNINPQVSDGGGLQVEANTDFEIKVVSGEDTAIWSFEPNGTVTFPDATVQSTAWTGIGDLTGSVFADNSTLLVDGVAGKIVGLIETASTITVTADGNGTLTSSSGYAQLSGDNGAELYFDNGALVTSYIGVEEDSASIIITDMTPGSASQSSLAMSSAGNTTLASAAWINLITNNGSSAKTFRFDSDGVLTLPSGGSLSGGVSYSPSTDVHWTDPNPTTVADALNRLAAAIYAANGGSSI